MGTSDIVPASIANEIEVIALAKTLSSRICFIAEQDRPYPFTWTTAVWMAFKEIARDRGWKLYPEQRPFKGEFLLDFVLWETNYGPRIVCESQWQHRFNGIDAIDWAFDKLCCIKGDIKILIYEWGNEPDGSQPPNDVRDVVVRSLEDLSLLSNGEAFLLLNITKTQQWAHWWQPVNSGRQSVTHFTPIRLDQR